MARIAYIDHSYHRFTHSTDFIPAILTEAGHDVTTYWGEPYIENAFDITTVLDYDAIVIFQVPVKSSKPLYTLHPNITFIPMLDGYPITSGRQTNLSFYWNTFANIKILNFSKTLHYVCRSVGLASQYYKYFQKPLPVLPSPTKGLHGFFWARRDDQISLNSLLKLIGDTQFDSFHLHLPEDPGTTKAILPAKDLMHRHGITTSSWFESKIDFEEVLGKANVFFASRLQEGIGQTMLEAFSKGQCVVAPDCGTMNEYIMDNVNGLLYDPENLVPLNFANIQTLGKKAWELAFDGYKAWLNKQQSLHDYILTPQADYYRIVYGHRCAPQFLLSAIKETFFVKKYKKFLSPFLKILRNT